MYPEKGDFIRKEMIDGWNDAMSGDDVNLAKLNKLAKRHGFKEKSYINIIQFQQFMSMENDLVAYNKILDALFVKAKKKGSLSAYSDPINDVISIIHNLKYEIYTFLEDL